MQETLGEGKGFQVTKDELIRSGLSHKLQAINDYESVIWKIRTGYVAILYGSITLLFGTGAIAKLLEERHGYEQVFSLIVLVTTLSVAVGWIDFSYVQKRLKYVVVRDQLVELAFKRNFESDDPRIESLLRIAGETHVSKMPPIPRAEYRELLRWNLVSILLPFYSATPAMSFLLMGFTVARWFLHAPTTSGHS